MIDDSIRQIDLDIGRTYPDVPYYSSGNPGNRALQRVLTAFIKYDITLGYVQGMNFIVGALLWHTFEYEAF